MRSGFPLGVVVELARVPGSDPALFAPLTNPALPSVAALPFSLTGEPAPPAPTRQPSLFEEG